MMLSTRNNVPFLKAGNSCGAPIPKLLKDLPKSHQTLISQVFPSISYNTPLNKYRTCRVNGVRYSKHSVVLSDIADSVPIFGEVVSIYANENAEVVFVLKKLKTICYARGLKAFKVAYMTGLNLGVMLTSDLVHHHALAFIKSVGANYVSVPCKTFLR